MPKLSRNSVSIATRDTLVKTKWGDYRKDLGLKCSRCKKVFHDLVKLSFELVPTNNMEFHEPSFFQDYKHAKDRHICGNCIRELLEEDLDNNNEK